MLDTFKVTTPAGTAQADSAIALLREGYSLLWTDLVMGEDLLPSDRDWMRRAKAFLDTLPPATRLIVESPEAT